MIFALLEAELWKTSMVNRKRTADVLNENLRLESSKIAKTYKDDDDDFFIEANHDEDDSGRPKIF